MTQGVDRFLTGATNFASNVGGNAGSTIKTGLSVVNGIRKLFGGPVSNTVAAGAEGSPGTTSRTATFGESVLSDWRVKLSVPTLEEYANNAILSPLVASGGFIFPFTPAITLTHSANYSTMDPMHNNYAFVAYENSKLDRINIVGDFYCEDSADASYWVASVHFFRSVTKMFFGSSANAGAPPPILKLNGYGDFVFNNLPVAVTQFSVELPKDVDYIPTRFPVPSEYSSIMAVGYVPVKSVFTVSLVPVYSREAVRNFNLKDFVDGRYLGDQVRGKLGQGSKSGGFV